MASPRRLACPVALILAVTAAALLLIPEAESRALTIRKRAAFYIANDTVCNVDGVLYQSGDPIPTEDPCETCKCRPPGFACTLRECDVKPHCKAVRREGQCCPEYHCGCEQEGKLYKDGEVVPSPQSPCYVCYCQGSSITCSLVACQFRGDCEPRYVDGECCPRYDHCPPTEDPSTTTTVRLPWSRASSPRTTGRFFTTRFQPTVIPGAGFSTHVPSKATDGGVHVPRTTFPAVTVPTRHIEQFSTDQTAFPPSLYDDLSSPQPVPDITNPVKRFTTHLPLPDETEARSADGATVGATETDSVKPLGAGVQSQDVDDKLKSTASKDAAGASAGSPTIIGAALVPVVPAVSVPAEAVPAVHVPTVVVPDATVPAVAPVVTAHVVPTIPIHSVDTTSFAVGGDTGSAVHTTSTGATVPSTSVSGAVDGVAISSGPVPAGADHSGASETVQGDQAAPGGATHTEATTGAVSGGSTLTVGGSDAATVDTASHDGVSTSAATATSEMPSDVSSTGTATDSKQATTTVVGAANNAGGTRDVPVDTTVVTGGQADTATQPESTSVGAAATPDAHPSDASGSNEAGGAHADAVDSTTAEVDTGAHTLATTDAAIAKETTNAPGSAGDSSAEPGQSADVTPRKSSEESAGEESHLPPSTDATTSTQQPSDAAGSDSSDATTAGVSHAAETDHPATDATPGVTAEHSSVSDVTTGGLSTGAHDDQSAATTGAAHDSEATPALSSDASGSSEASPAATESSTGTESADANKGDAGSTPSAVSITEASPTTPEAGSSDQDTKTGSESGGAEPTTPSAAPVTSAPDVAAPTEKAPDATSDSEPTSVKSSVEGADEKTTTAGLTVSDAGTTTQAIESSTPSSTENVVSGSDESSARSATGGEQPLADQPHQGESGDDTADTSAKKEEPAHDAGAAGSDDEKPQGDAATAPDGKTEENEAVPKKDSNEFDFSSTGDKTSDASGSAGHADADGTTEHAPASDASAAGSGADSTAAAAPKSEDSTQSENVEREEHPEGTPETTNAPADTATTTTEAPHHDEEGDAGSTPVSETPIVPEEAHTVSPDNEGDKPEATTQAPHADTTPHDDTAPHDDGAAHDNGAAPDLGTSGGDANGGDSTPPADGGDSAGTHPSGGNGGVTPSHEHKPHSHPHHDYGGRVPPTIEQLLAQLSPDTRRQYELDHGIIHPSGPEVPTNGGDTHGDGEGDKPTDTGAPSFPGSTEGDSGHEQTTTTTQEPPAVDGDAAGSDSDFLGSKPPTAEPAPASPGDGADDGSEHKEPTDGDHATPSAPEGDSHTETTTPSHDSDAGTGSDVYGPSGSGDEHKNEGGDSLTEKPHEDTTTPPSSPAAGDEDDAKTNEVTESPKLTTFPTRYTTTGDDDHHDEATTEAAPSVPSEAGSDAGSSHDEHHSGKDEPCGTVVSTKSEDTTAVKTHDPIVQLVKSGIPDLHLDGSEPHRDRRRSGRSH